VPPVYQRLRSLVRTQSLSSGARSRDPLALPTLRSLFQRNRQPAQVHIGHQPDLLT
jgi:hypothetical protein